MDDPSDATVITEVLSMHPAGPTPACQRSVVCASARQCCSSNTMISMHGEECRWLYTQISPRHGLRRSPQTAPAAQHSLVRCCSSSWPAASASAGGGTSAGLGGLGVSMRRAGALSCSRHEPKLPKKSALISWEFDRLGLVARELHRSCMWCSLAGANQPCWACLISPVALLACCISTGVSCR